MDQEIEVKFLVAGLAQIEARLQELGARLVQPRTFEINLRFDTPAGDLARNFQVLRLRQDTEARLTYKGQAENLDGARLRQEIEFTVGDFETARRFLEALGYTISMKYEKYRSVYILVVTEAEPIELHVMVDELPYGDFVEIEGPDAASIRRACSLLGLEWGSQAIESYTRIFELYKAARGLEFRDLSFENFKNLPPIDPNAGDLLHPSSEQPQV